MHIRRARSDRERDSERRAASERERETVARLDGGSGDRACAPAEPPPSHPALRAPRRGEGEGGRNGEFLGWFSAVEKGWNGMEWSLRLPSVGTGVSRGGLQRGPEIDNAIPRLPLPPSTLHHSPPKLRSAASIFFASLSLAPSAPSAPFSARVLEMLTP